MLRHGFLIFVTRRPTFYRFFAQTYLPRIMDRLSRLAPLAVSLLISGLAYGSQVLFVYMEPYALDAQQTWIFNLLVLCIWICYVRACVTNAGHVPPGRVPELPEGVSLEKGGDEVTLRGRWCRRCKAFKPPRAHHCKTCQRFEMNAIDFKCKPNDWRTGASRKWITIVLGPSIVFLIELFLISCVFSYMPWHQ